MNGPLATSLPAARNGHCLVKFEDKIFSTGGQDENGATSNVWQFNLANNFAKADRPEMKKTRDYHGCGIVHSIHHDSRPLLVVAGSYSGTGGKSSEFQITSTDAGEKCPTVASALPSEQSRHLTYQPTYHGEGLIFN